MRWRCPSDGDVKIKKKFALLPITIDHETRWLEWVNIRYKYFDDCWRCGWTAMKFVDEE